MRTTNLKYVGWVEEIINMDYEKIKVVVLYCTWAQANRSGTRATMKCNEYDFTFFKFDSLFSGLICISPSCATRFFCG
jgi:hypothetical protein